MGCSFSKSDDEKQINKSIEAKLTAAQNANARKIELLILGTGDSGKTTLRKQLTNLHGTTFQSEAVRQTYVYTIINNLVGGVLELLNEMNARSDGKWTGQIDLLQELSNSATHIDEKLAGVLRTILNDPEFKTAVEESIVPIQDCWFQFREEFEEFPVWGGQAWIPSVDDCIRSRIRTSGVITEEIKVNGVTITIFDVGGQRAERRKWMHMFSHVTATIFVTAISEYDQTLFEDKTTNRLVEAFELFSQCFNSNWLEGVSPILFLNKKDIFHEKYITKKIPLNISGCFPSAPTSNENEKDAIDWFSSEFRKRLNGSKSGHLIIHTTTAIDKANVKKVFDSCRDVILRKNMASNGFSM